MKLSIPATPRWAEVSSGQGSILVIGNKSSVATLNNGLLVLMSRRNRAHERPGLPELRQFALQIGSSPLDEAFERGHAAVEILARTRPPTPVQRGFRTDVGFELVQDGEEFVGGEFFFEQLLKAIQESRAQARITQETILQPVPARDRGCLACAQQNGKIGRAEGTVPMIAKRPVEIPGKDKPLARAAPVTDEEMVFIEAIPVLNQNG